VTKGIQMTVQTSNIDPLSPDQKLDLRARHEIAGGGHYFRKVNGLWACRCGVEADAYGNTKKAS
jgi:hypothetical protein